MRPFVLICHSYPVSEICSVSKNDLVIDQMAIRSEGNSLALRARKLPLSIKGKYSGEVNAYLVKANYSSGVEMGCYRVSLSFSLFVWGPPTKYMHCCEFPFSLSLLVSAFVLSEREYTNQLSHFPTLSLFITCLLLLFFTWSTLIEFPHLIAECTFLSTEYVPQQHALNSPWNPSVNLIQCTSPPL